VNLHRFTSMGCEVVVGGADESTQRAIEELFRRRDRTFSRFDPDSELNRVNAHAGSPVGVSGEFASMLTVALEAARESGGLVDPTVGPALEAAGYDTDFELLVEDGAVLECAARPDWRSIRLFGRYVFAPRKTGLDLNGVVKGKTVDDALELIAGDGFVSGGGDIAVRGGATVALPAGGSVDLVHGALATSGIDRRRWLRGGSIQHHLIDPGTGRPSTARWTHVTACGGTCLAADIAAKAAFLLDEDGPEWLSERGIPGRFVDGDEAVVTNAAWRAFVPEPVCT